MDELVSCVVRFHDAAETEALSLALMSLAGQTHPSVEPIVVLQDFSETEEAAVAELCDSTAWPGTFAKAKIVNLKELGPGDHRARLLNAGIDARSGRYLAFLDYDDYLYGAAYTRLLRRLEVSGKAIAFGAVIQADVEGTPSGNFVLAKKHLFQGAGKYNVFLDNQHPIHSFVLDTLAIDPELLKFDVGRTKNEDYAFVLRLLANHDWDLGAFHRPVSEYVVRADGTNTIMAAFDGNRETASEWREAEQYVSSVKHGLNITISVTDLTSLLVDPTQSGRTSGTHADGPARKGALDELTAVYGAAIAKGLVLGDLEDTHRGSLDVFELDDGGSLEVAGWIASEEGVPAAAALVVLDDGDHPVNLAGGLCETPRPDVSMHLHSEGDAVGFRFTASQVVRDPAPSVDDIVVVAIMETGDMLRFDPRSRRGPKSLVKTLLRSISEGRT